MYEELTFGRNYGYPSCVKSQLLYSTEIYDRGIPREVLRVREHPHQPDFLVNVFLQLERP